MICSGESVLRSEIMNHFLGCDGEWSEGTRAGNDDGELASGFAGTILYVEDEAFVHEVTAEVLRAAGYQVLPAKNAAEAGDIFQEYRLDVDLLLTDVILPGETGRELAAKLRRTTPRLKVLYVTGYTELMAVRLAANEDCLAKPFSTDALLERVRRMMDSKECPSRRESRAMLACAGA
jgi:two-component system cell cycle sensor histidine kinase/response regulator CckA